MFPRDPNIGEGVLDPNEPVRMDLATERDQTAVHVINVIVTGSPFALSGFSDATKQAISDALKRVKSLSYGGPVDPAFRYLIGERGRELFVPVIRKAAA